MIILEGKNAHFYCFNTISFNSIMCIEMYEKKVWGVALATCSAAALNVFLNSILIPLYGYVTAAYTTLVCYAVLCFLHYFLVKRLGFSKAYCTGFIIVVLICIVIVCFFMYFLYRLNIIRYICIVIYIALILISIIKNKKLIKNFLNL